MPKNVRTTIRHNNEIKVSTNGIPVNPTKENNP